MDYDYSLDKVKESILSKEINFLTRFEDFNFEDEFIEKVLKVYSDFNTFEEISDNFDFESVKLFYIGILIPVHLAGKHIKGTCIYPEIIVKRHIDHKLLFCLWMLRFTDYFIQILIGTFFLR